MMRAKKRNNYNLCLIDMDGFTSMKYNLKDDIWLSILEDFKKDSLTFFDNMESTYIKLLGDGILITNNSLSHEEWLKMSTDVNQKLNSWKTRYSHLIPDLSYSIIFSIGDYFMVSQEDIVGKDIDELFLIEHNAPVGEVLLTRKMHKKLKFASAKGYTPSSTSPIAYLGGRTYEYYRKVINNVN